MNNNSFVGSELFKKKKKKEKKESTRQRMIDYEHKRIRFKSRRFSSKGFRHHLP